jgi:hypothetical protein
LLRIAFRLIIYASLVFQQMLRMATGRASLALPEWKKRTKGVSICMPWTIPPALLVLWSVVWMFNGAVVQPPRLEGEHPIPSQTRRVTVEADPFTGKQRPNRTFHSSRTTPFSNSASTTYFHFMGTWTGRSQRDILLQLHRNRIRCRHWSPGYCCTILNLRQKALSIRTLRRVLALG